jgi:uncharacterized protein (TIGR03032 family)
LSNCGEDQDKLRLWESQNSEFRNPAEIVSYWQDACRIDPLLLKFETAGQWWSALHDSGITLLVSREYEHLLLGMYVHDSYGPTVSMMRMPHPSGIAVNRSQRVVHVASTRNPNQIFDLMPLDGSLPRLDLEEVSLHDRPLLPVRTSFYPGCLYTHDLAMIGDRLHANSVGQNSIVKLSGSGAYERVWWPKCIETDNGPVFEQNHLQLNSIAAGPTLETSFFSASTDEISSVRPGDPSFPVDGRGVIFSGATREPIARGLTRPPSARLHNQKIWVENSGYGQIGYIDGEKFQSVAKLPGWTRGLCFFNEIMFVGTSRILSRFQQYAPGVNIDLSCCGIHALDIKSGLSLGSIIWPHGSQIFGIEAVPCDFTTGFAFPADGRSLEHIGHDLFYTFQMNFPQED